VAIDNGERSEAKCAGTEHDTRQGGVDMQVEGFQLGAEREGGADGVVQCGDLVSIEHGVYDGEFENGAGDLLWVCDHSFACARELKRRRKRRDDPVKMCQRRSAPCLIQKTRPESDVVGAQEFENAFDDIARECGLRHEGGAQKGCKFQETRRKFRFMKKKRREDTGEQGAENNANPTRRLRKKHSDLDKYSPTNACVVRT
jgi:hypothetical protein